MVAVFSFATPTEGMSTIRRVGRYFDMILGSINLIAPNVQWLLDSHASASSVVVNYKVDLELMTAIDQETTAAINLLRSVGRLVRIRSPSNADAAVAGKEAPLAIEVPAYRFAIGQTLYCFAEDVTGRIKGYFETVILAGGSEFVAGIMNLEPMALFVLMYWGVLVDRVGKDPMMWAIGSAGRDLVGEISDVLTSSQIADVPGVAEGIEWTRRQVKLPSLLRY
jgi:hypothetical protein